MEIQNDLFIYIHEYSRNLKWKIQKEIQNGEFII